MSAALLARYGRACAALGCGGGAVTAGGELVAAWKGPGRAYHGVSHLEACLALFDEVGGDADRPAEVEFALFFHDAVYDPRAMDNEARSAAWARDVLSAGGAPVETAARVRACILATRLSAKPESADAMLMVDIDRAILGADREHFDAYETSVRAEYSWVLEKHYVAARVAVLEGFLAREKIFMTAMCARFEAPARANIARAVAALAPR